MNKNFLSPKLAAETIGLSLSTLQRLVKQGVLKKPVQITDRRVGFPSNEIQEFIEMKIGERDEK